LQLVVSTPLTEGGIFEESLPSFGLFSLTNIVVFMIPEAFREGDTFIKGNVVEKGFPGGVHFFGSACLFPPERCRFVGVKEWGSCEEIRDSGEALVGVDGKKCW